MSKKDCDNAKLLPSLSSFSNNNLDRTTKWIRLAVLLCGLLTVASGVILYLISTKVSLAIDPVSAKLDNHIIVTEKRLASITGKKIFDVTVGTIKEQIQEIRKSQEKMNEKQDSLRDKLDGVQNNLNDKLDDLKNILLQIRD